MKRITAAVTAIIMTAGMTFPAFAEEQAETLTASVPEGQEEKITESETDDGLSASCGVAAMWKYDPETKTLTVSGSGTAENLHFNTHPVWIDEVETVIVEDGIGVIGAGFFNGCKELKEVILHSYKCEIEDSAFDNCDPSLLIKGFNDTPAEEFADKHGFKFEGTEKPEIEEEPEEEDYYEEYYPISEYSDPDGENKSSDEAEWKFDEETKTLTVSGTGAAELSVYASNPGWKEKVETAVIENGVTGIGEGFFGGCKNLKSVSIPDSVICIDGAFYDCTSLKTITLPDSIDSLYQDTFAGCTALEEIHLGNQMQVLGYGISLGEFNGCTSLERINLPDSLRSITSGTFNGCTSLKEIAIPDHVESIDEGVFKDCTSLAEVTLGSGVYYIHTDAFGNCESLEKIVIPEKVRSIDEKAFAGCKKLKEVTVLSEECIIEDNSFEGCDPSLVIKAYKGSKAEKYAERNGFTFEAVQKKVPTEEERKEAERKQAEEEKEREEAALKREAEEKEQQKAKLIESLTNEGMRGDINGDGIINVFDVMRYKKKIINGNGIDPSGSTDINRNGSIDESDVAAVMNDALGKSVLWSYGMMPKMDGAVLNSSLEAGFKAKLLGMHFSEACVLVSEHSDKEAFDSLVSGENDMIFSTGVTEEQKEAAEKAGVKLISVPVAKEGLVFIVNRNNPVDSLTSDQIRDIYSGKITNWKEVGGNDEVILPYQRNAAYDSHKYLKEFMNGAEFAEPLKIGNSQAVYDNAENALGYSVYSYAAQMFENASDIKYIAVDGIKPDAGTMKDGSYPVVSTVSAVYTEGASQSTKDLAEWILSSEGQAAVSEGGFIPVKDIEYPEEQKPYYSKGTGAEKPADYSGPGKGEVNGLSQMTYFLSDKSKDKEKHEGELLYSECMLNTLKNSELQDRINADIKSIVFGGRDVLAGNWIMNVKMYNGYMNIAFIKTGYPSGASAFREDYITLNYDLVRGKRLEHFSDLFFKDEEYVPVINKRVSEYLDGSVNLRTDYLGMLGDITNFGLDYIVLDKSATYSGEIIVVPFHSLHDHYDLLGSMAISEYHDNWDFIRVNDISNGFVWKTEVRISEGYSPGWVENFIYGKDGKLHYDFFSRSHTESEAEERNSAFESLYEKACSLYTTEFPETAGKLRPDTNADVYDPEYNERWGDVRAYSVLMHAGSGLPYREYHFDPDTKEQIFISDIFGNDFKQYDDKYWFEMLDMKSGTFRLWDRFTKESGGEMKFSLNDVNMKYLPVSDADVSEYSRVRHGYVSSESALVYPESYVVKFNKEKKGEPVGKGVKTEIRNYVYSLGKKWYECWNADNGDYCGWISEDDITVQNTEEENKLYSSLRFTSFEETPIRGRILSASDRIIAQEQPQDVICYTNESVMDANSELNGSVVPLDNRYAEARNKCLSHGKWLYECWSGGKYIGWVEMHDFQMNELYVYEEEGSFPEKLTSERTGTVPGEKYNGLDFYSPIYIVSDTRINSSAGCVREDIKIRTDKRCLFHGEWWYECSQGGRYLGWINGDLIEFD
ncbi:MAG: leucine-rich repeat protein [Oscillospiraceae bacterium]|nr:leucine-rich repeat protein [Oscillospiraceae bacterium]